MSDSVSTQSVVGRLCAESVGDRGSCCRSQDPTPRPPHPSPWQDPPTQSASPSPNLPALVTCFSALPRAPPHQVGCHSHKVKNMGEKSMVAEMSHFKAM